MAAHKVDYAEFAPRVVAALRDHFPQDTIAVREGYLGHVHVRAVSEQFDGLSEREKQALIWRLLERELGDEAQDVALAMAYGVDEL